LKKTERVAEKMQNSMRHDNPNNWSYAGLLPLTTLGREIFNPNALYKLSPTALKGTTTVSCYHHRQIVYITTTIKLYDFSKEFLKFLQDALPVAQLTTPLKH